MDWLTFISNVISALIWPIIAAVAVIMFRTKLVTLLDRFNTLLDDRVTEASLTREGISIKRRIEEKLQSAKEELLQLESVGYGLESAATSPFFEEMHSLAATNTAAAVASASARLEVALRDVLAEKAPDSARMSLPQLISEAVRRDVLTESEGAAAQYLSQVRNDAVHQNGATEPQALEFADLAFRIAAAARGAGGSPGVGDPL